MSLWRIAWTYIWRRAFVTVLTVAGVALGAALVSGVLTLRRESRALFLDEAAIFDIVVGAKGSPLQLTLSAVYHLDAPTGNIPWDRYLALRDDFRVRTAIPLGLGDNYRGYRIVGTTPGIFEVRRWDRDMADPQLMLRFAQGGPFVDTFDAVLGSEVARQTGLGIDSVFVGVHGIRPLPGSEAHDDFPYRVVGVLAPSGTSKDRAILVPIEAVWEVHRAEAELHRRLYGDYDDEPDPEPLDEDDEPIDEGYAFLAAWDESRPAAPSPGPGGVFAGDEEATAVLVQLRTAGMRMMMSEEIRNQTEAMAAIPLLEMQRLTSGVLRPMERALLAIAALVCVVALLSVLATLLQSAERRRRDAALLRVLGAHPAEILVLMLLEAVFISLIGTALGWLLGHGGAALAAAHLRETMGIVASPWSMDRAEWTALLAIASAGVLAGLTPALLAYRRSPVRDLAPG